MPLFSKRIDHTNAADQWEQSEPHGCEAKNIYRLTVGGGGIEFHLLFTWFMLLLLGIPAFKRTFA